MEWSHNKKKRWYAETGVKGIPKQNEHSYKKKERKRAAESETAVWHRNYPCRRPGCTSTPERVRVGAGGDRLLLLQTNRAAVWVILQPSPRGLASLLLFPLVFSAHLGWPEMLPLPASPRQPLCTRTPEPTATGQWWFPDDVPQQGCCPRLVSRTSPEGARLQGTLPSSRKKAHDPIPTASHFPLLLHRSTFCFWDYLRFLI